MVSDRCAFGERLKRQRERRGVSLESISQTSKVAASLFEALERGDCSRWPAGLYSRAYVRTYAEAVGLNPDETVEEFSCVFGTTPTTHSQELAVAAKVPSSTRLRLTMAPEPAFDPEALFKRVSLAAADVIVGALIAAVVHVGLGASVWITLGCVLAYYAAGRVVSDQPLLYAMYLRLRTPAAGVQEPAAQPESVPVGDAASTAA
jgi:transcriptional regulator with XRE-family HTH domain